MEGEGRTEEATEPPVSIATRESTIIITIIIRRRATMEVETVALPAPVVTLTQASARPTHLLTATTKAVPMATTTIPVN